MKKETPAGSRQRGLKLCLNELRLIPLWRGDDDAYDDHYVYHYPADNRKSGGGLLVAFHWGIEPRIDLRAFLVEYYFRVLPIHSIFADVKSELSGVGAHAFQRFCAEGGTLERPGYAFPRRSVGTRRPSFFDASRSVVDKKSCGFIQS